MKLTDRQIEKAIGLRKLLTKTRPESQMAWTAFVDYTRALGVMLDAVEGLQNPQDIKKTFDAAWKVYVQLWGAEHERILNEALGNDEMLVDKVKEHQNGRRIIKRILDRVKQTHGAISAEVDASSIEITDILIEEMDDEWSAEEER